MNLASIRSEGALFSDDILKRIAAGEPSLGQKATDFGLDGRARLEDEIASCWSDARAYWDSLQRSLKRLKDGDTGVTETRSQWVLPLMTGLLGSFLASSTASCASASVGRWGRRSPSALYAEKRTVATSTARKP